MRIDADEDDQTVTIVFPHRFFGDWFTATVRDRFEQQLSHFLGPGYTLAYKTQGANGGGPGVTDRELGATRTDFPHGHAFTLDSFIVNTQNYFPLATAREVARAHTEQESAYNPVVFVGPPSSGKTHLLKAIANEVSRTNGPELVRYTAPEELPALAESLAQRGLGASRYLIMDELQRIREQEALQHALLAVFDAFHDAAAQMVFACAVHPAALELFSPGLKSRLESGLVVTMQPNELEVRVKLVKRVCQAKRLKLNKDQMLHLAQHFEDMRQLQGVLLKLFAYKELVRKDLQDSDFQSIVRHAQHESAAGRYDPKQIIDAVAEYFNLPSAELTGHKRSQAIVFARQVAMYLCRELLGASYPALGRLFGGKDHSTAMYAVKKIHKRIETDSELRQVVALLKKRCS